MHHQHRDRRDDYIPETLTLHTIIARRIKQHREAQGLSLKQLAVKAGLKKKEIKALEVEAPASVGFIHFYDLYEVALALGVDHKTLIPSRAQVLEALPMIHAEFIAKLDQYYPPNPPTSPDGEEDLP